MIGIANDTSANTTRTDQAGSHPRGLYIFLNRFTRWPMFFSTCVACLIMLFLFAAGFYEFGRAIVIFFSMSPPQMSSQPPNILALKTSVRALEYLLLAPLPYLLMLSMVHYVESMASGEISARVRAEMAEVKAFWVSLLIGILAATLVAEALANGKVGYESAISGGIVIALLVAYFYQLNKMASSEAASCEAMMHEARMAGRKSTEDTL